MFIDGVGDWRPETTTMYIILCWILTIWGLLGNFGYKEEKDPPRQRRRETDSGGSFNNYWWTLSITNIGARGRNLGTPFIGVWLLYTLYSELCEDQRVIRKRREVE